MASMIGPAPIARRRRILARDRKLRALQVECGGVRSRWGHSGLVSALRHPRARGLLIGLAQELG